MRPGIELLRAKGIDAITDDVSIALVKAYGKWDHQRSITCRMGKPEALLCVT